MILIDWNGVAIGSIVAQKLEPNEDLIRHMILNSIRMYRAKFRREYGEIVICCDGGKNWRKEYFPNYKAKRKESREKSSMDWNEVFRILHMVKEEIKVNFPYKVVEVDECEADDIIAHLALQTMEFGQYENVMIVSADKDFAQLQTMDNVKQYSPMKKNFIKEDNPRLYLREHILKGDASDGVPNVLSDDNCFVEGRRQTPLRSKVIDQILSADWEEDWVGANDEFIRNIHRNRTLIDLTKTPTPVVEKIINTYEQQDPSSNKTKVLPYLIEKRCKLLIEDIEEFISDY